MEFLYQLKIMSDGRLQLWLVEKRFSAISKGFLYEWNDWAEYLQYSYSFQDYPLRVTMRSL